MTTLVRESTLVDTAASRHRGWERGFVTRVVLSHTALLLVALGLSIWFRTLHIGTGVDPGSLPIGVQGLVILVLWLGLLQWGGAFEARVLGVGTEELKRITLATVRLFAFVAITEYLFSVHLSQWLVAFYLPLGWLALVGSAMLMRGWLRRRRAAGEASYSILAVGSRNSIEHLHEELRRVPLSGLHIVGACLPENEGLDPVAPGVPVVGTPDLAVRLADQHRVDVVAAAGVSGLPRDYLRELGWELEGTGHKLLVAPGIAEVAGPRISVVPVSGLPLVWVDEPTFTGLPRLLKRTFDLVLSTVGLVLISPLLLLVALAIKVDSRGPVFFRQARAGIDGEPFLVWKFRTMYVDAEARRAELGDLNESDGHLFKLRSDPRVTRVGRLLRRFSVDELPQLFNVVSGDMSLVGPRPLPLTDSDYEGHARRRLLVLPGITGLWQVTGRSDTTWDEATRLDLYYVENWSLSFDLLILARTAMVVLKGEGAY